MTITLTDKAATVRAYLRQGTIKGVRAGRLWRITETALKDFMEKGTENETANRRGNQRLSQGTS